MRRIAALLVKREGRRMETPQVKAQPREAMGKGVKKLRREGVLPGVVYGTSIAGVEPIVASSPIPLAPSGFSGEGVSVRSFSNIGRYSDLGMA